MFIKAGIQFSTGDNSFLKEYRCPVITGCEGLKNYHIKIEAWSGRNPFQNTLREILKPLFFSGRKLVTSGNWKLSTKSTGMPNGKKLSSGFVNPDAV
jgi:hypothetical protein